MNIDKMINMLLLQLSKECNIFYMEKRNYKGDKIYKTFFIKTDDYKKEFKSKSELLLFLSKRK